MVDCRAAEEAHLASYGRAKAAYDRAATPAAPLALGQKVRVQSPTSGTWADFGVIKEKREDGEAYIVQVNGKLGLRNRRFLKPAKSEGADSDSDAAGHEACDRESGGGETEAESSVRRSERVKKLPKPSYVFQVSNECSSPGMEPLTALILACIGAATAGGITYAVTSNLGDKNQRNEGTINERHGALDFVHIGGSGGMSDDPTDYLGIILIIFLFFLWSMCTGGCGSRCGRKGAKRDGYKKVRKECEDSMCDSAVRGREECDQLTRQLRKAMAKYQKERKVRDELQDRYMQLSGDHERLFAAMAGSQHQHDLRGLFAPPMAYSMQTLRHLTTLGVEFDPSGKARPAVVTTTFTGVPFGGTESPAARLARIQAEALYAQVHRPPRVSAKETVLDMPGPLDHTDLLNKIAGVQGNWV